ncbi:hypothetical protein AGMMS4952_22110 [Spirochaetia bacterium]|nr:hypothetical protein AGMMS4952_22110 [Spirochaetia bacterium]
MTAIIIGLGSMGRRRLRLLRENFPKIVVYGVDQNIERCQAVRTEFNIGIYFSIQEVLSENEIDYAFICTSPLSHAVIISVCLENTINVFTEINLVSDKYREKCNTVFVFYTLMETIAKYLFENRIEYQEI